MKLPTENDIEELDKIIKDIDAFILIYNKKAKELNYFCRITCQVSDHHDMVLDMIEDGEEIDENWHPEYGWFPSTCY